MDDKLLRRVKENPMFLEEIENPSNDLIMTALKKDGMAIKYVKCPSIEQKKQAIKSNPLAVKYIDDLNEELEVLAVTLLWN